LTKAGCIVTVANHGQEALEALQLTDKWKGNLGGTPIDVVLMDVEMPVMDGLAATRQIRSLERAGDLVDHIEIIAVTANVRQEQIERANEAGVDGTLPKPFVVSELLRDINDRLGQR
jgi:CheY-like chemotaxis protein